MVQIYQIIIIWNNLNTIILNQGTKKAVKTARYINTPPLHYLRITHLPDVNFWPHEEPYQAPDANQM